MIASLGVSRPRGGRRRARGAPTRRAEARAGGIARENARRLPPASGASLRDRVSHRDTAKVAGFGPIE